MHGRTTHVLLDQDAPLCERNTVGFFIETPGEKSHLVGFHDFVGEPTISFAVLVTAPRTCGLCGWVTGELPKVPQAFGQDLDVETKQWKKNMLIDPFWMFASLGEFQPMAGSCSLMDYMWQCGRIFSTNGCSVLSSATTPNCNSDKARVQSCDFSGSPSNFGATG